MVFVKRSGRWYFANFLFLEIPHTLILVIVLAAGLGFVYAGGVLLLFFRLRSSGEITPASLAALFVPLFWRRLYQRSNHVRMSGNSICGVD